jgi:hypothetical protein
MYEIDICQQPFRFTEKIKVRFKVVLGLSIGLCGVVSAQTEYTSLASWDANVTNQSTYAVPTPPPGPNSTPDKEEILYNTSLTIGPGVFTTPGNIDSVIWNDGSYGNAPYYSASPDIFTNPNPAIVTINFAASADITALAFDLGAFYRTTPIDISMNGSALAPLAVSSTFPTAFLGVTDSSPITSISFEVPLPSTNDAEMDVIGAYETAVAIVPELDTTSAASCLTLLFGGIAVLRGRKIGRIAQ